MQPLYSMQGSLNSNLVDGLGTDGGRDDDVWDGGPKYCHQCSPWDGHCWILGKTGVTQAGSGTNDNKA